MGKLQLNNKHTLGSRERDENCASKLSSIHGLGSGIFICARLHYCVNLILLARRTIFAVLLHEILNNTFWSLAFSLSSLACYRANITCFSDLYGEKPQLYTEIFVFSAEAFSRFAIFGCGCVYLGHEYNKMPQILDYEPRKSQ